MIYSVEIHCSHGGGTHFWGMLAWATIYPRTSTQVRRSWVTSPSSHLE